MSKLINQKPFRCANTACGAVLNFLERSAKLDGKDSEQAYSVCGYCGAAYRSAQTGGDVWPRLVGVTTTNPNWVHITDESELPAKVRDAQKALRSGALKPPPGMVRNRPD